MPRHATVADLNADERVRLTGVVRLGRTALEAPLSGRACAAWVVRGWEYNALFGGDPELRIMEQAVGDWTLEDDTGTILIRPRPRGAVALGLRWDRKFDAWPQLGPRELAFLAKHGASSAARFDLEEAVLEGGIRAMVAGRVERIAESASMGAYRDLPGRPLELHAAWIGGAQ